MTDEDRAVLREEIQKVLADTFGVMELFDTPVQNTMAMVFNRCVHDGNAYPLPLLSNGDVDFSVMHSQFQQAIRRMIREYMQATVQAISNKMYNAAMSTPQSFLPY